METPSEDSSSSSREWSSSRFLASRSSSIRWSSSMSLQSGDAEDAGLLSGAIDWPMDQLVPARLTACGHCDQLISGQCTFTGREVLAMAAAASSFCPLGLWPGEIPHKFLKSTKQPAMPFDQDRYTVLLTFPHGFGDHVQLTTVLLHLQRYRPCLEVDIACRAGCESLFRGLCRNAFPMGHANPKQYDVSIPLWWHEPSETYKGSPSTKAEKCLREVFRLDPDPALCRYACHVTEDDQSAAAEYLRRMNAEGRAVLIHYQGRCGRELKDLSEMAVEQTIEAVRRAGCVPFVLDWDGNSTLVAQGRATNAGVDRELWPTGIGDAARLAALAAQSRLCVGIDSGPGHLFGAVNTPTVLVWKYLHPVNYYGLADHVTHLVPKAHGRFIRGDRATGERYFGEAYSHRLYSEIENDLAQTVGEMLNGDSLE